MLRKWKVEIIIISVSLLLSISAKYLPDILQLSAAAEYQFYFIVGIYVNRHFSYLFKPKNPALQCISVLLCVAVLLLRVFLLNMFLSYLYALSGCILIFKLSLLLNKMNMKPLAVCILNNSYGIYLFHPMIVYLLYSFTWNARISPYFLSSAVIIFSFCISLGLTECMRKTKLRFAIGAKID